MSKPWLGDYVWRVYWLRGECHLINIENWVLFKELFFISSTIVLVVLQYLMNYMLVFQQTINLNY